MKYRYRLFCPDCLGNDPQGCFDGGYSSPSEEEFDTVYEAAQAGFEAVDDVIWEWEVIDAGGVVQDE